MSIETSKLTAYSLLSGVADPIEVTKLTAYSLLSLTPEDTVEISKVSVYSLLSPAGPSPLDFTLAECTTHCWAWRVVRQDGGVLGFTDHDRDISFGGETYEAASGFSASELKAGVGLSVDDLDAAGALSSDTLKEGDLAAGLYDNAAVQLWRVNWADTSERVLMLSGVIGEVRRGPVAFTAELRSLAHQLDQEGGRTYQYACDADLGDARCGVDLASSSYKGTGAITTVDQPYSYTVSGLGAFDTQFFQRGLITFTSGANAGRSFEIRDHVTLASAARIDLWVVPPSTVSASDAFTVTAGCDKTFATCKAKFSNALNFRGFPHMPGNDFIVRYPNKGDRNDGGVIVE